MTCPNIRCECAETYLFVVRSPLGKEIHSAEIPVCSGLLSMASTLMDVVRSDYPTKEVECCEIWQRTEHRTMSLIATAF